MSKKTLPFLVILVISFLLASIAHSETSGKQYAKAVRLIVTSDTILSGMISSLLPSDRYSAEAILPPGQCPGHYDVKLSDIEKMQKADLYVSFRGMSFLNRASLRNGAQLLVDASGRNWMAPNSYIYGVTLLAEELSKYFPEDRDEIMSRKQETIRKVKEASTLIMERVKKSGIFGKAVIASSMQKEVIEWLGFRVVGEYGRPESMSAKEIVRLSKIGRDHQVVAVIDNLQSGPDAGKGIAEALGVPHVVLTNFPSEKGYLATLQENVAALMAVLMRK